MKGLHREKSPENLKQQSGENASSISQGHLLLGEFRRGRRSLDNGQRCGTPATGVTVTDIEAAGKVVKAEPRITTREIQESLSIGMAATMSILHNHLGVRKRCARWIPHSLTDERRWVKLLGASSCCESSTEAVQN